MWPNCRTIEYFKNYCTIFIKYLKRPYLSLDFSMNTVHSWRSILLALTVCRCSRNSSSDTRRATETWGCLGLCRRFEKKKMVYVWYMKINIRFFLNKKSILCCTRYTQNNSIGVMLAAKCERWLFTWTKVSRLHNE